ncbi:MAG: HEAT repeat domain-containing protein [Candidatus Eremiobacteraeota bacterium]|nr:HEAT repeat domain-containing protein [Candidatus Eremiobacteraeota bacterium]
MPKGRLEEKLAKLRQLREADEATRSRELRSALRDANNFVVAKATALAAEFGASALIPDLLEVYGELFGADAATRDPLVRAKDAIVRALRDLGHRDPAPFVRGLHHVQLEPVWGALEDAASRLRCACAQALVDADMPAPAALRELIPHLVDPFTVVRVEAVTAVAQIGGEEGLLLVRLKAYAGDAEAEVVGACFAALVDHEPADAVDFIAPFLRDKDEEVRAEAAAALALSRDPRALEHLRDLVSTTGSKQVRAAAVTACAGSPQPAVVELLLDVIAGRDRDLAQRAVHALAQSRFRESARARARAAARRGALVRASYDEAFSVAEPKQGNQGVAP